MLSFSSASVASCQKTLNNISRGGSLGGYGEKATSPLDEEYCQEILDWLLCVEVRTLAIPEYMQNQTQLTWKMRKTLVLWLVQVSLEFGLTQDSLYLAVNLLDRVSSQRSILSRQYQLLGLSCLWIAAKVHENHGRVPTIKKLMYICCQTYTFDNFVNMERFVLIELGCYLNHVSCEEFVSLFSVVYKLDPTTTSLARYLIEQSLIHKRFVGVRPSLIARSAVNLASCLVHGVELLGVAATEHDHICQAHLRDCLRQQPVILLKKYGGPDWHFSSRYVEKFQTPSPLYSTIASHTKPHQLLTPPKDADDLAVGGTAAPAVSTNPNPFSFGFW